MSSMLAIWAAGLAGRGSVCFVAVVVMDLSLVVRSITRDLGRLERC
jgi:hypothetical protein